MQNNVNFNISWYEGHTITSLGKIERKKKKKKKKKNQNFMYEIYGK